MDQRGFTFLEVIIALGILGALVAIAFGGMRVGLAAWQQGEARAEVHQHARGIAHTLARVIAAAYPYSASAGQAPGPELLFRGEESHVELVTAAPPAASPVPVAFAAVVIELGTGEQPGLVIRQHALPNRNPFEDAAVVLRDPTITGLGVAYLDDTGTWRDAWNAEQEKTLPRALRVTLTSTDGSGRPTTLPAVTIPLRVLTP
jgi:prepilin-type N-terminal cleavage/methylation domain-containing protein